MKLNFNINIATLLLIVGAFIALLLWNSERKEADRIANEYAAMDTSFKSYKSKTDGAIISYKESVTMTQRELKKALKSDSIQRELVKKYKELAESVTIITEWKHDTIKIAVPIFIKTDTTIDYQDKCFNVDLKFANGELSLSDMQIYNRVDMVSGNRKVGFLKYEYSADVRNTNPCIITTGMTTYRVTTKPKWFEHPVTWGIVGAAGGFYLNHIIK